jgi:hypothetical protein
MPCTCDPYATFAVLSVYACVSRMLVHALYHCRGHVQSYERIDFRVFVVPRSPRSPLTIHFTHFDIRLLRLTCLHEHRIVGAGAAFSSNARTAGFPYPQSGTLTDSLIGRCYGRNLTNPGDDTDVFLMCSSVSCVNRCSIVANCTGLRTWGVLQREHNRRR